VSAYERADQRWHEYPNSAILLPANVKPVSQKDMINQQFLTELSEKLSFDISRFAEFIEGYSLVAPDIKPLMLHYAVIYLLDFFTRTWVKMKQNPSHVLQMLPQPETKNIMELKVNLLDRGVFPRAVDAFYLLHQSSLYSNNAQAGIMYSHNIAKDESIPLRMEKLPYYHKPATQISLGTLLEYYERLTTNDKYAEISMSNKILTGFLTLFLISSISRYRPKEWFSLRNNSNLFNKVELLTPILLLNGFLSYCSRKVLSYTLRFECCIEWFCLFNKRNP
jgi:hypothetical protein